MNIPPPLAALPRDERGYPVPYFASVAGGVPDFRQVDTAKHRRAVRKRLCGLCGQPISRKEEAAFVGGPLSSVGRVRLCT